MKRKGASNLIQYVAGWVLITVVIIVGIFYFDFEQKSVLCVDGSYAKSKQQCPQCTETAHCGNDKVCGRANTCIAKPCMTDDDCDTITSQCVYDRCMSSNYVFDD
jgi:hypothetical protein